MLLYFVSVAVAKIGPVRSETMFPAFLQTVCDHHGVHNLLRTAGPIGSHPFEASGLMPSLIHILLLYLTARQNLPAQHDKNHNNAPANFPIPLAFATIVRFSVQVWSVVAAVRAAINGRLPAKAVLVSPVASVFFHLLFVCHMGWS